eukprot:CAMPEP_0206439798 /NCGR_PEP_ID=MMETSP0324_2-20121206/12412_1 /ASSEMBLY_ACC=CAM_ASM_000836 /TAXON_ID=2866 /ORGANISM="Crypthecodinium cohnii, Strain Seligo" /LENGTH=50 /DNA_ID=CAMNT_0053907461 /DNA_START=80 /DNA_END=229 /DNA_ORIENTATION=-
MMHAQFDPSRLQVPHRDPAAGEIAHAESDMDGPALLQKRLLCPPAVSKCG